MPQQPSRVDTSLVLTTPKGKARPAPVEVLQEAPPETVPGRDASITTIQQASGVATMVSSPPGSPPLRQGKVALNFRLDPEMHRALRTASFTTGASIQQIVETAVRAHLKSMGL